MVDDNEPLRQQVAALQQEVAALKRTGVRGVRKRSSTCLCGLPLYDIAFGPDPETNQVRGYARGIFALGDVAIGVFALGGVAFGIVTCGGCSVGILLAIGGAAFGGVAIGGLAVGLIALGGAAVGLVAIGGGAYGYYACGGGATGKHVITAMEQDPEAVRFFKQWVPGLDQIIRPPGG
jgi:hypothetical protein